MPPPRMRFTVRRMMASVVILSVSLAFAPELLRMISRNTKGHAPFWVVPIVRTSALRLKPGMTSSEVWRTLGPYGWLLDGGMGGGPFSRQWISYSLRPDCGLILEFDHIARPPRLVGARLVGDGW